MYNFFVDESARAGDSFRIAGADHNHIKNVLRMRPGEQLLISCGGVSHLCELMQLDETDALVRILREEHQNTELPVRILLFQGLPKSDKMEWIIQKCVELGAAEIIPVEMRRCVMKVEEKKKDAKRSRWQAIAESAAKQSKRSVIPEVGEILRFGQAMERAGQTDLFLVPYENEEGMKATRDALLKIRPGMTVSILIGPEGGFEESEIESARNAGAVCVSLGKRILRTETAAVTAVGMCMLQAELMESGAGQ